MYPVLQVALDLEELTKAVEISTSIATLTRCEHVWIEAGTPLVKAWGKIAIRALKELTKCYIVADTKTMDVPSIEAKIVFNAGADAFTVLGVADEETLREAVEVKKNYGKALIIDLIGVKEPYKRAVEVSRYEPDVITFHVGISAQRLRGVSGEVLLEEAVKAKEELGVRVGIAGGLKPGGIRPLIDRGVDVVIVGSAITKAPDPAKIVREILGEMGYSV